MRKTAFAVAVATSLVAGPSGWAQPADPNRTVRPGDRIEWSGNAPHRVQFGGATSSGPLTRLADVDRILTFIPALTIDNDVGESSSGGAPMLVAIVKDDAASTGIGSFVFTCGQHPAQMRSLPFSIVPKDGQPMRTLKIRSVGLDWMLDTPAGPIKVDAP